MFVLSTIDLNSNRDNLTHSQNKYTTLIIAWYKRLYISKSLAGIYYIFFATNVEEDNLVRF